jgi:hypothetical protein
MPASVYNSQDYFLMFMKIFGPVGAFRGPAGTNREKSFPLSLAAASGTSNEGIRTLRLIQLCRVILRLANGTESALAWV